MNAIAKFDEFEMEWSKQEDLIRKNFFKDLSQQDYMLFKEVCKHTRLNPIMKQIYPVMRRNKNEKGDWVPSMVIQVSIDGLRLIADRTGRYAPGRESTFTYDKDNRLLSATSYAKKRTSDGTWHEISYTCFYDEYVQYTKENKPTKFWAEKPHVMLSKCAEAGAIRKGFPAETSRVYTPEEIPAENVDMQEPAKVEISEEDMLSDEQIGEINTFCEKHPDFRNKFFTWMKVVSADGLPASAFQKYLKAKEKFCVTEGIAV